MKIFVYNYKEDEKEFFEEFSKKYGVELGTYEGYPSLENAEMLKGYDGASIYVTDMNAEMLQKFHDMGIKYITTRSVGFDHFDLDKAEELGIKISTTPYAPDSVANYAIMMILMSCRKARHIIERSQMQDFTLAGKRGKDISSATVGVIATGKIGRTLIKHLSGFGCRILAYDIFQSDEVKEYAEYVDLETLYRESDIITMHAPSTKENYHMVNSETLKLMKDGVIIVNCARGNLIDTEALISGLESGKVGAAALDVIENEFGLYYNSFVSQAMDNRELALLRSFPNVILTPHTAFYTDESAKEMAENAIKGCVLFDEGKENPFEVC